MDGGPAALIGSLLMLGGIIAIFVAVVGAIIGFGGFDPQSLGDFGLISIAGYPLAGKGALIVLAAGVVMILIGSTVHH